MEQGGLGVDSTQSIALRQLATERHRVYLAQARPQDQCHKEDYNLVSAL